jgi:L-lactate dehydrogenase complex protein LldE
VRVSLFVTCLIDQLRPEVGEATVAVLERAGCEVHFDPRQTCCGQPACNSGYRDDARTVARQALEALEGDDPVVVPSGSCAAQLVHLADLFEEGTAEHARAKALAPRVHELSSFLVDRMGIDAMPSAYRGRVTWHDACHGLRDLGTRDQPRRLLRAIEGVELVELASCETCCGFGGTFSVTMPELSVAMADRKLDELERAGLDAVVSADLSCLMQLGGRLEERGSSVRTLHLAEVLAG